jgi:hypothetical protein
MSKLLEYLSGSDDPDVFAEAMAQTARRRGARRLQAALTDTLSCDEAQAQLVDYVQAVELAASLTPELQAVAAHLAHCEECAADFAALQQLSRAAGEMDTASALPQPNLDFLRQDQPGSASMSSAPWWREISATGRQLVKPIEIALGQTMLFFKTLPGGLSAQPAPMPVLRDRPATPFTYSVALPDPSSHLLIELSFSRVAADQAEIVVGVFELASRRPAAQATVSLSTEQRQLLRRTDTGPDGQTTFRELAPGGYHLQIRINGKLWELALALIEAP